MVKRSSGSTVSINDMPRVLASKFLSFLPLTDRATAILSCKLFYEASSDSFSVCDTVEIRDGTPSPLISALSKILAHKRVHTLIVNRTSSDLSQVLAALPLLRLTSLRVEHCDDVPNVYVLLSRMTYPHSIQSLFLGDWSCGTYSTEGCAEAFKHLTALTSVTLRYPDGQFLRLCEHAER